MKTQASYVRELNLQAGERVQALRLEKNAMEQLVSTLTSQNREIVGELESHMRVNESVRQQLDRKREVAQLMDTFNKDLLVSKANLERVSPRKYAVDGHSALRQSY